MERAIFLFGQFRRGEANDPDTYTATISLLLSEFDADVIQHVTDPRTGLVRTCKFLPDGPEVLEACNIAKGVLAGLRIMNERQAAGYRYIEDRADNRLGWFNSQGERWEDRQKQSQASKPVAIADKRRLDRAIGSALLRIDEPKLPLPEDDSRHFERIKHDLERRRQANARRAAESTLTISENPGSIAPESNELLHDDTCMGTHTTR